MITWQESNIERPKSLVQIAADAIRRGIILRELVMGQPLTEAGLAKTLGISKTPVREGLIPVAFRRPCGRRAASWLSSFQYDPRRTGRFL